MKGYYVDDERRLWASICEVSYEKRAKVMLVGVSKVRDIVGRQYRVPSKVSAGQVFDTLEEAVSKVKGHATATRTAADELIAELDAAVDQK